MCQHPDSSFMALKTPSAILGVVPMDAAARKNLHDDLRGIVRGELLFDDLSRVLYASDASLFEVEPAGIVVPRDEDDLCALVRYAVEHDVPLIARGAGTGLAGESLGTGVIVDLSLNFNNIEICDGGTLAHVQPGVTLRQLNAVLKPYGRRFAVDSGSEKATIGGMLATNAGGPRAVRFGTTRDHVESLRVVLDSGDTVNVGRVSRWPEGGTSRLQDIVSSTVTLLEQSAELMAASRPRVPLDRCGYAIHDVLGPQQLDLARLLVGSEGTLALFTQATLRTRPLAAARAVVLLAFARIDAAIKASRLIQSTAPNACELLDRRLLRLARGEPTLAELVPDDVEAALVVEYEADTAASVVQQANELIDWIVRGERLAVWSRVAGDAESCERFWLLHRCGWSSLAVLRGAAQPVPIVEDVAVPPETLANYLPRVQDVLRRLEVTAAFLVSTGTGQVQMWPFLDLRDTRDVDRLWKLADEVYPLVLESGGTISSRHGTGLARMPWLGRQVGPLGAVYRDLKTIFDPRFLFNPGKIVPQPTGPLTWPLRRRGPLRESLPMVWETSSPEMESLACNGCGACRTTRPGERMCPIFRATGQEAATPRAKANLMRYLLHPDTDPALLTSDDVREVADLCVNCKMCATECPSRVQIPKLMLEAKAANVTKHGLGRGDRVFASTEGLAWLGSAMAPISNALMSHPLSRWLLERIFGVSRRRRLPRFASGSFLRLAKRRGWTNKPRGPRPRVAYFVDLYANYNDPLIAESVVAVLHHNGIEVYVPPDQVGCGMAALAHGDAETARDAVRHNLRVLADLAREGFPILCSEPSAAVMFRQDAPALVDDSDTRLVAAQVVEFTAFLADLHAQGLMRTDFAPVRANVGHHVPCHLKALGRPPAGPDLLKLIPELQVGTIDVSCSGMAGTFGLRADRYEMAMKAGSPMLEELSRPAYLFGSTECSACRMQMEDGTEKRTLHPAQYLALAYGLMPAVAARLREPIGEWVLQ